MISINKQRGATFIFWVFFVALIGFLLMVGAKLFPAYYTGITTDKIIEDVALDMQSKSPNKSQIWKAIDNRININGVNGVNKDNFIFEKNKDSIDFGLNYEIRVPIIANFDVVAMFNQRQTIASKK